MEITSDQSKKPQFLKSVEDLAAFSAAVLVFKREYDDLQKHMDFIDNAIDSKLKSNGIDIAAIQSALSPPRNKASGESTAIISQSALSPPKNDASGESTAIVSQSALSPPRNDAYGEPTAIVSQSALSPPRNNASGDSIAVVSQSPPRESYGTVPDMSSKSEGQRMCDIMCVKGLRKYVNASISDRAKLLEDLPVSLKRAKEPAKFVLECIGKFYLQGRRAFTKNSLMVSAREVSLLIMESFLLMLDPSEKKKKLKAMIESSTKEEAESVAVTWRKRLITEGGLAKSDQMDARGLLLLISCFGVPSIFRNMDLLDLMRQSGTAEIASALRRSPFLVPLISGIVESSIKRGMHIEALGLVYTFGMEDKFSASSILTSFLSTSTESFERAKRKAKTPTALKEANEKQLATLLSVLKCLGAHKLDPTKEVPGWRIQEQITKLEIDILKVDKEMEDEARSISLMEEAELTNRLYNKQMKRPRLSAMEMQPPPAASSSYSPIYRDRSFPSQREEDRDEISALVSSYLGQSSGFPHRRRSPEYMVPPSGLVRNVSAYEHLPPNSYSPVHGSRPARLYSPPIHEQHKQMPIGLQSVYRHSSTGERYLGLPSHRSPHESSLDRLGRM